MLRCIRICAPNDPIIRRALSGHCGEAVLYFGCRNADRDFLFKDEIAEFTQIGALSKSLVAFSRDAGSPYHYVQDCIKADREVLLRIMLKENGVIFVCGSGTAMAASVDDAISAILRDTGLDAAAATALKKTWHDSKRYIREVWA